MPDQLNVYNNFGQPPVTLFNNSHFVVDLYFWLHSDTSIHTHSFTGAFKVLFGQSHQEIFNLKNVESFEEDIRLNEYEVKERRTLKQGECQMITPGDRFCHRVSHLNSPTVTLCMRTINDKATPQWHQFENGLSILKVEIPQQVYKTLFFYQYFLSQSSKRAKTFLQDFINQSAPSLIINLFEEVLSGALGLDDEVLEKFHNMVLKTYRDKSWFQLYLEACSEE